MAERHGFHEAHFTSIPCQSNVYGLTSLAYPGGVGKALVAPLKDKVVSLEYMAERGKTELQPVAKEIHFAGIPDDAEIISIDSSQHIIEDGGGYIIGITFTKDAETDHPSHILNLYAPWDKVSEYGLDSIAQMWTNIELDFTPYYLGHTKILEDGEQEIVFLLTGSDNQVHLYREEQVGRFSEHPAGSIFPEFNDLPCVALWLDSWNLKDCRRLSVVGCRSGYVRLVLVNTRNNEVMNQWEMNHDSAITCSQIFTSSTHMESASSWLERREDGIEEKEEEEEDVVDDTILDEDVNLLITSSVEGAVVYRNVLKEGFGNQTVLPQSDLFDCALCTCVADLDWDGQNELLIGTYGQALLAYKYILPESESLQITENQAASDSSLTEEISTIEDEREGGGGGGHGHYELLWSRSFAHPLLALNHVDLTGDGLKEVIVLSTRGVHVLQHNLDKAAQRCLDSLKQLDGDDPT